MFISYFFDIIVMGLLATTITYCYILNTRLRRLRDHETDLRQSIAQLFKASKNVESAVKSLKTHSAQPIEDAREQAMLAEEATVELSRQIADAKLLMGRLQKVVKTAKQNGMSNDKLLNRNTVPEKGKSQTGTAQAPDNAKPAVKSDAPQMPDIPEPQPLQPNASAANHNGNAQFGKRAATPGGQAAMSRLEQSLSGLKSKNGRAA